MEKVDRWTARIWHCDPLVVADEAGLVLYADKATVEFQPLAYDDVIGHAQVLDAEPGPPIEIDVTSRLDRCDRIPDVRLGIRDGFTLFGLDPDGRAVTWYTDGAADNFAVGRAAEAPRSRTWDLIVIRDVETGAVLFEGRGEVEEISPEDEDHLARLRLTGDNMPEMTLDETDRRTLWPTLSHRSFGLQCMGTDEAGRAVEWYLGHPPRA